MTGLTNQQVQERIDAGKVNANENPNTRTYKQIIRENTLTFFNFLNLVLLALVLFVGSYKFHVRRDHHYQYSDRYRSGDPCKEDPGQAGNPY